MRFLPSKSKFKKELDKSRKVRALTKVPTENNTHRFNNKNNTNSGTLFYKQIKQIEFNLDSIE